MTLFDADSPDLMRGDTDAQRKRLEVKLLLDALYWRSGLDLRQHAFTQIAPIVDIVRQKMGALTITAILARVLHDDGDLQQVQAALSRLLETRESGASVKNPMGENWGDHVLPLLRSTPFPTIWVHDCCDIDVLEQLLFAFKESDLVKRSTVFATCSQADGIEALRALLRQVTDSVTALPAGSVIVAEFNIITDSSFNEFDFILCGSELRKLSRLAQRRVMRLLGESLAPCGVLQLLNPSDADAARAAPVFLPMVDGVHLYRHALLERYAQQRRRGHVFTPNQTTR